MLRTELALAFLISPSIAADNRVKRFFKGVQLLRRCTPKYESSWDPKIVLQYLESLDSESINMILLSKKLTTLLALATAQRLQTLSLIDIRNIQLSETGIEVKISDKIKTSRHNTLQPNLFLPFLVEKPQICVARTLQIYLLRSSNLRNSSSHRLLLYEDLSLPPQHKL